MRPSNSSRLHEPSPLVVSYFCMRESFYFNSSPFPQCINCLCLQLTGFFGEDGSRVVYDTPSFLCQPPQVIFVFPFLFLLAWLLDPTTTQLWLILLYISKGFSCSCKSTQGNDSAIRFKGMNLLLITSYII